jgi:hypothetical protein
VVTGSGHIYKNSNDKWGQSKIKYSLSARFNFTLTPFIDPIYIHLYKEKEYDHMHSEQADKNRK